jgi:tellurite resistance-related uncharacterized protein
LHGGLIYDPGHAEIWYNESADWLAGNATPYGQLELMQADLLYKATEGIREQEYIYEDTTCINPPEGRRYWCRIRGKTDDMCRK